MARLALGANHTSGVAQGTVGIGASAGTAHVILEVDNVAVTTMSQLRAIVNSLMKNYEGILKP